MWPLLPNNNNNNSNFNFLIDVFLDLDAKFLKLGNKTLKILIFFKTIFIIDTN